MRKICICILAMCLLLFVGCRNKTDTEPTVTEPVETVTATLGDEDIQILAPTRGEEETTPPTERRDLLEIMSQGSLSGKFVEDGSDESVENVACALIRNRGDQYLDYGMVTAVAGEQTYQFVVTGLPGGEAVWVMDKDRKTLPEGTVFTFAQEEVSQLRRVATEDERVEVDLQDGKVSVHNISDKPLASVRIYYKTVHSDGNFLGGITYTCVAENIQPGATVEAVGGHSRASGCAVVRVDVTE